MVIAHRCLAFASKSDLGDLSTYDGASHPAHRLLMDPATYSQIESDLIWLGVAGLQDPPRPEVASAIAECHAAGINVRFYSHLEHCCILCLSLPICSSRGPDWDSHHLVTRSTFLLLDESGAGGNLVPLHRLWSSLVTTN